MGIFSNIKNKFKPSKKEHFYGHDLWGEIKEDLKEFIPKGYTLYGECVGYTKEGSPIQKDYDYGCEVGQRKIYIYRITFTNEDGLVNNLSTPEIEQFCNHFNLNYVPVFYKGKAKDYYKDIKDNEDWIEKFINILEKRFNDKNCYLCNNKVPEEGIVIRKESMFEFEAYKLKSYSFLERETKLLDKGEENLEDNQ